MKCDQCENKAKYEVELGLWLCEVCMLEYYGYDGMQKNRKSFKNNT